MVNIMYIKIDVDSVGEALVNVNRISYIGPYQSYASPKTKTKVIFDQDLVLLSTESIDCIHAKIKFSVKHT